MADHGQNTLINKRALAEARLHELCFDAYAVRERRVVRSPERKLFILHDYCSADDILAILAQWQTPQSSQPITPVPRAA